MLFQAHATAFPPPEAATAQLTLPQQEAVHRHCLGIAAGRGTQRTTLDKHTSALENHGALQGKTSVRMEEDFFFLLFFLPSCFSSLISHKSESIFSISLFMTNIVEQERFKAASFSRIH